MVELAVGTVPVSPYLSRWTMVVHGRGPNAQVGAAVVTVMLAWSDNCLNSTN